MKPFLLPFANDHVKPVFNDQLKALKFSNFLLPNKQIIGKAPEKLHENSLHKKEIRFNIDESQLSVKKMKNFENVITFLHQKSGKIDKAKYDKMYLLRNQLKKGRIINNHHNKNKSCIYSSYITNEVFSNTNNNTSKKIVENTVNHRNIKNNLKLDSDLNVFSSRKDIYFSDCLIKYENDTFPIKTKSLRVLGNITNKGLYRNYNHHIKQRLSCEKYYKRKNINNESNENNEKFLVYKGKEVEKEKSYNSHIIYNLYKLNPPLTKLNRILSKI